ncbi:MULTISPECIES: hypothetical protein [unclassified Nonomuraea]|uniref:hypothetical protein n=1 Tax=unclassified Nonomuraea TaxID=2593643 RepID=UPI0033FBB35C
MADEKVMVSAIATATAAAGLIGSPWAWYVTTLMGTVYGHVSGMSQSQDQWKTQDHQGQVMELDELATQMAAFKKRLQDEGKWEGSAWETFEGVYESFKKGITALADLRNATGDGVDAARRAFSMIAILSGVVATGMLVFGIRKRIMSMLHPVAAVAAEGESIAQGATTTSVLRGAVGKQLKIVAALGFLLYMANQQTETSGKLFPMMKTGMPTEMSAMKSGDGQPPFSNTALQYDEQLGLTQKMDDPSKTLGTQSFDL